MTLLEKISIGSLIFTGLLFAFAFICAHSGKQFGRKDGMQIRVVYGTKFALAIISEVAILVGGITGIVMLTSILKPNQGEILGLAIPICFALALTVIILFFYLYDYTDGKRGTRLFGKYQGSYKIDDSEYEFLIPLTSGDYRKLKVQDVRLSLYPDVNFVLHKQFNDEGQAEWVLSHKETGRYIEKDEHPETTVLKALRKMEKANLYDAINR